MPRSTEPWAGSSNVIVALDTVCGDVAGEDVAGEDVAGEDVAGEDIVGTDRVGADAALATARAGDGEGVGIATRVAVCVGTGVAVADEMGVDVGRAVGRVVGGGVATTRGVAVAKTVIEGDATTARAVSVGATGGDVAVAAVLNASGETVGTTDGTFSLVCATPASITLVAVAGVVATDTTGGAASSGSTRCEPMRMSKTTIPTATSAITAVTVRLGRNKSIGCDCLVVWGRRAVSVAS